MSDFSDTLLRDCCSTNYLDLDVGMESCLAIVSQQLRYIFGFVSLDFRESEIGKMSHDLLILGDAL